MSCIGIVEDDKMLNRGISVFLEKEGHTTICGYSLEQGRKLVRQGIDLLILDIGLPDGDGVEFCRELRETFNLPVIFLTAMDTEQDIIEGFEAGCDDYVSKPFSLQLLGSRVKAVLRRDGKQEKKRFAYDELEVDYDRAKVWIHGKDVSLTSREYRLLELLCKNKGMVLSKEQILEKLWDADGKFIEENTLNVAVKRLRQKIEEDPKHPQYVKTVFGMGYRLGE